MKKLLISLTFLLITAANAFAQQGAVPPQSPEQQINKTPQRPQGVAATPPPVVQQPVIQNQPSVRPQPVSPQNVPASAQPNIQPGVSVPNVPANVQQNVPQNIQPNIPGQPNIPSAPVVQTNGQPAPQQLFAKPREENYIILNFDNADLRDVINTVSSITKENFIISPGMNAQITIHSAKKIPVSEVMNVFESVLEVNGMSLVKSGDFYKIVQGASAKQKAIEIKKGNESGEVTPVDRIITQIVAVEYVPVSEVTTVLTPLLSQFGSIIPNPRNSILIVNDMQSNIKRLLSVLNEIDVNVFKDTRMLLFQPKYSDVTTISNDLTDLLNALNLTKEGVSLVPLDRINSLIVFAPSPSLLQAVEGWIKKLDEEITSGQNIFVYPVQNVKAADIAEILKNLYEAEGTTIKQKAAQPAQPGAQQRPAPAAAPRPAGQKQSSGGRVEIITFEPTNSLIILAPPGTYRDIVETVKKIDQYPREVLIEAIVAQVTLTDSDEYGIQWSALDTAARNNNFISGDVTEFVGNAALSATAPTLASGVSGGLSYIIFKPDKLTALVRALASSGKVDILSSPRLLVRDQEEASIEVGSEIPTATSTTTTVTTTDTPLTQSIQYKTIGIKLKIKPTISEEKTVVLNLEQEVSSLGDPTSVGGFSYPSFNTTKTKTSIVVPDKQGIVIGGIMEETKSKSYQGIPLLSSIPILGSLFRYQTDSTIKKELVILITPQVVVTKEEGGSFTNEFLGRLKEVKRYLTEKELVYKEISPETGTDPSKQSQ
ncbi:MAG: type II secretion system secretin GspD [Nitrospirae bacterium]|nr:type II secretion system secretin GspD [Nitrospirota bacterium]